MQRIFFPFVRGVGGSASSEDQIGGNILSIFNFSRGKNQSCLKGAETLRNEIKKRKKKELEIFIRKPKGNKGNPPLRA